MAWMRGRGGRAGRLMLVASMGLGGCSEGQGRLDTTTDPSTTGQASTGSLTTFQPATSVDPSVTLSDSGSTESSGPDGTGSSEGPTGTDASTAADATTAQGTTTTDDPPPSVQAVSPVDRATGVAAGTPIAVTFSEAMAPATITANTADEACTGTLQASADGFATCIRMAAAPSTDDDQTFTVSPAASLASATTYQVRVLGDVTDAGGTPMGIDFTTATGFVVRYFHTIVIDGVVDFTADETLPSSTPGHTGYVAWDDAYVYLGMSSPDLGGSSSVVWMVSYLGGPMGTTSGVTYNTQQPLLPFDGRWHLRWRASDDFGGALEWTGAAWANPGFGPTAASDDVAASGSFVEMRVARADLGDPDVLPLHLGMLREQNLSEASWAAVPAGSYVDGYDPDYGQYLELDLLGSTVPIDHPAL